jgi:hypothetical protein
MCVIRCFWCEKHMLKTRISGLVQFLVAAVVLIQHLFINYYNTIPYHYVPGRLIHFC